jgi:cold shock CspA family protein
MAKAGMESLAAGQRSSFEAQPDAKGSKAVNLDAAYLLNRRP